MTTAFAASDVVEGVDDVKAAVTKEGLDKRSYNPIRDDVFGGNELAYALTGTGISLVTDIVTGAVIAKIPERISASMAAKSAKRAAKKAARDAAKAAKVAEKAEKTAQTLKVAKTAETVEKTEGAAKAVSAAERFYSKLDALKLKVQEIPHTLTAEEVRACEAVKLRMKGELSAVGKVSVEEVEKIDEAVKAASTSSKATDATKATTKTETVMESKERFFDVLEQNRINGRAFEQQEFAKFRQSYNDAVEQITIKTSSGIRTRVDAVGLDPQGNVVISEFKSSATAPLTQNQKRAFPELTENGGGVVGKGKGIFTGGYQIPEGTKVKIIRP